jgi:thiol-disulfide isomerase/thioredoxin
MIMNKLILLLATLLITVGCAPHEPGRVVLFGADWCPPCKEVHPKLEVLAADLQYEFEYVNTDSWNQTNYYIPYIPRVLILAEGSGQTFYFGYPSDEAIQDAKQVLLRLRQMESSNE